MLKKTAFIFAFVGLVFMGTQAVAATKTCKTFYEKHQMISAHLKQDIAKQHVMLAKEPSEKQEKYKAEMKKLDDTMTSLEAHMTKMGSKVNPASKKKQVKYSLSRCKKERMAISDHVTKIEQMLAKLDKEFAHDHGVVPKKAVMEMKANESKEAPQETPKEGIWDRVKKLFNK